MTRLGAGAGAVLRTLVASTASAAELTGFDAVLRTPLPLSRRIGFVALAGGSGTSTTAASVASLLASRRVGTVLAVDAGAGPAGLSWQTGDDTAENGPRADPEMAALRRTARSGGDARQGLARTATGLYLLDLADGGQRAAPVSSWRDNVAPIARFFDLVVTDWGVRPWQADLDEVADASNVIVVVARADRHSAIAAAAVVPRLRRAAPAPRLVLVLVDVGRTPDRIARGLRQHLDVPVHTVGYDPERARYLASDSRRLAARTRRDHLDLATTVVKEAICGLTAPPPFRLRPAVTG